METGKKCAKCGEWKLFWHYSLSKDSDDGHQAYCKKCNVDYQRSRGVGKVRKYFEWKDCVPTKEWLVDHYSERRLSLAEVGRQYAEAVNRPTPFSAGIVKRWLERYSIPINDNTHYLQAFGETKTLVEWSKDPRCAIKSPGRILDRVRNGYTPEEAITTKPFEGDHVKRVWQENGLKRRNRVTLICTHCGKEFERHKGHLRTKTPFCSQGCYLAHPKQKSPVTLSREEDRIRRRAVREMEKRLKQGEETRLAQESGESKVCCECKQAKWVGYFAPVAKQRNKSGYDSYCRECRRERSRRIQSGEIPVHRRVPTKEECEGWIARGLTEVEMGVEFAALVGRPKPYLKCSVRRWLIYYGLIESKAKVKLPSESKFASTEERTETIRKRKRLHVKTRRANRRGASGKYTQAQWDKLVLMHDGRCAKCGEKGPLTADHIIPVVLGGSNLITNIQPLCSICNSKKQAVYIKDYRDPKVKKVFAPTQLSLLPD